MLPVSPYQLRRSIIRHIHRVRSYKLPLPASLPQTPCCSTQAPV